MTDLSIDLAIARANVASIEKEVADQRRRTLEGQHEQLTAECRIARDKTQGLRAEANRLQRRYMTQQAAFENMRRLLNEWRDSEPSPNDYPLPEQRAAWHRELEVREIAASEASKEYGHANVEYRQCFYEWRGSKEVLEGLADRESELRSVLQPRRSSGITIEVQDGTAGVRLYRG